MYKLVLVLAILGCSDQKAKEAPAAGAAASDSVAKLQAFKAQMCACKDASCATTVNDAMEKWSLDKVRADDGTRPAVSSESIQAQALLIEDIGKCKNAASGK